MKILHLSDLHLPFRLAPFSLRGKMIIGYTNYSLRRAKKHPRKILDLILEKEKELRPDAIVISGDLTNVSHPSEFEKVRQALGSLLGPRTFVIPGNHDRYTKRALSPTDLYEKSFGEFSGESISSKGYLRVRNIGGWNFLGVDSNAPRGILDAYGRVDLDVIDEMLEFLERNSIRQYILVCHHPIWNPPEHQEHWNHRLQNREDLAERLASRPPILFLHGHLHSNWVRHPDSEYPYFIINSASSTRRSDSGHQSGFHLIDWNEKKPLISRYTFDESESKILKSELIEY